MTRRAAIATVLLFASSQAFPMMKVQAARKITGCCCPIVASIFVSGVAVKAERFIQGKIGSALNKTLDFTFGKIKTD